MSFAEYLSTTGNRDNVMAVLQFGSTILSVPAGAAGNKSLAESLVKLASLADGYRTVTRLFGLVNMLDSGNLKKLSDASAREQPIIAKLGLMEYAASCLFFPFENLGLLTQWGVINKGDAGRVANYGGVAVFFWWWSLTLKLASTIYRMLLAYPYLTPRGTDATSVRRQADWRRLQLTLLKTICWWIFAMGCLPAKGKPQLLRNVSGFLVPLHRLIELLSPSALSLSPLVRGVLGMIATSCDIVA